MAVAMAVQSALMAVCKEQLLVNSTEIEWQTEMTDQLL